MKPCSLQESILRACNVVRRGMVQYGLGTLGDTIQNGLRPQIDHAEGYPIRSWNFAEPTEPGCYDPNQKFPRNEF